MSEYGGSLLLDASAWARLLLDRITGEHRTRFEEAVRADEVMICEPFRLEALYSARDRRDYLRLEERLAALPQATSGPATMRLAIEAQAALAAAPEVSHRVRPVDLLVAAVAHDHSLGVLHYDHDYDVIAAHTGLRVRSVWVAPRGSVS